MNGIIRGFRVVGKSLSLIVKDKTFLLYSIGSIVVAGFVGFYIPQLSRILFRYTPPQYYLQYPTIVMFSLLSSIPLFILIVELLVNLPFVSYG